jgi:hypothetical protein
LSALLSINHTPTPTQRWGVITFRPKHVVPLQRIFPKTGDCLVWPYSDILKCVLAFFESLSTSHSGPAPIPLPQRLLWVMPASYSRQPNPTALAAHGLSLEHTLFLYSPNPLQALSSLCQAGVCNAIVVEGLSGKDITLAKQIGNRWVKPVALTTPQKASQLEQITFHKLFLLMDPSFPVDGKKELPPLGRSWATSLSRRTSQP